MLECAINNWPAAFAAVGVAFATAAAVIGFVWVVFR